MLKEIAGNNMTVICNNCNAETIHDLTGREVCLFAGIRRIRKYFDRLSRM